MNSFETTLFSAPLLSKIYDGFIKLTLNDLIEDDLVSFMSFYYYFNNVIFSQVLVDGFFANQLIIKEGLEKKFNKKISFFFNNLGQITNEELFFNKSFKLNFEEIKKSLMLRNSNLGIPITL